MSPKHRTDPERAAALAMGESLRKRLGALLRDARAAENLSQEKLSDKTGISQGYISAVERGERNITIDNLVALAAAVGLRIEITARPFLPKR